MTSNGSLVVGLAQINSSFSGQRYLPYSVGLLEAYARRHATRRDLEFLVPLHRRMPVEDAARAFADADVVGFSAYVWNEQLSLAIARRLKERRPDRLVVFGGPQVPDGAESFLREHPFIDVVVHGEGERPFLALLESLPGRDWSGIEGVSWVASDGAFVHRPASPRLRDLAGVPSPYLEGTFAPLITENPEARWIALWETNRGCPFQCTFCDWGSATAAKVVGFDLERLYAEAEWFGRHAIEFVFCCDANFGILPRDVELARRVADVKARTGHPRALSVQNTKNATERAYATQVVLAEAGLNKGVALSLQSLDGRTLEHVKRRNISLGSYLELQRRFTRDGIETYSDLILGLPGETYDSFADGVGRLVESGQHGRIQFNNLSLLPNAELSSPAERQRHDLQTVRAPIVNVHGTLDESDGDVQEYQELLVATRTLPRQAWQRARVLGWVAALLHFDKLLQIPLVLAHELCGIPYRTLFEAFVDVDGRRHPLLGELRDFLVGFAASIQEGGPEYVRAPAFLDVHWPADEAIFLRLTAEGRLPAFHAEAGEVLHDLVAGTTRHREWPAVADAVRVNAALVKQPWVQGDVVIRTAHDVLAFHAAIVAGNPARLSREPTAIRIDRTTERWSDLETFAREVVWWGNKKGAYLYGNRAAVVELAGHF